MNIPELNRFTEDFYNYLTDQMKKDTKILLVSHDNTDYDGFV
jgi:hypothetical protein